MKNITLNVICVSSKRNKNKMNNNSINDSVFLRFDFTNEVEPVCFTEPVQIITTNLPDEVPQCLQAIERATSDGYYVAGYMSFELSYALFRSEEHTSELQSRFDIVCRLL